MNAKEIRSKINRLNNAKQSLANIPKIFQKIQHYKNLVANDIEKTDVEELEYVLHNVKETLDIFQDRANDIIDEYIKKYQNEEPTEEIPKVSTSKINPRRLKIITGENTRLAYANVWEPNMYGKYSCTIIIPKSDTKTIERIASAVEECWAIYGDTKLKGDYYVKHSPIHDGDVERDFDPAFANSYYIKATSTSAPAIIDKGMQPITEHSEIYSGVYARASITVFPFNKEGVKGIACALNSLQKMRDGESIASKHSAYDDFSDIDE